MTLGDPKIEDAAPPSGPIVHLNYPNLEKDAVNVTDFDTSPLVKV